MPTLQSVSDLGALVRQARLANRLSQGQLAETIGVSRFWVVRFEQGSPGSEIGLVFKALRALGLTLNLGSSDLAFVEPANRVGKRHERERSSARPADIDLADVLALSTSTHPVLASGWSQKLPRTSPDTAKSKRGAKKLASRRKLP